MNRMRTPGPFWIWLIAAIIFAQVVKRGVFGWSIPADFNFGSRFLDNFLANVILGIPVLLVYFLALGIVNFGRKHQPVDKNAAQTLIDSLQDDRDPKVRAIAARALADLDHAAAGNTDRIAPLQSAMKDDPAESVRDAAKASLEKLTSKK